MGMSAQLILASASPRRKELLTQLGVRYETYPLDIDETPYLDEVPDIYVTRVAAEKSAQAVRLQGGDLPVLAADTTVTIDGEILGKPRHHQEAMNMLSKLSGRTHLVYSAISLRGTQHWQVLSKTQVTFREIKQQEIINYCKTGEPFDKAGAYAIQGLGGVFVASICGSYSGVVGLPIFETAVVLSKQGIEIFHD
jgi:septum formation protein